MKARSVLRPPAGFSMPTHKDKPALPLWFVVNMCSRWNEDIIERGRKPTKLHRSLASAYEEAARLAGAHKKGDYAIFECIGRCRSIRKKPAAEERTARP